MGQGDFRHLSRHQALTFFAVLFPAFIFVIHPAPADFRILLGFLAVDGKHQSRSSHNRIPVLLEYRIFLRLIRLPAVKELQDSLSHRRITPIQQLVVKSPGRLKTLDGPFGFPFTVHTEKIG